MRPTTPRRIYAVQEEYNEPGNRNQAEQISLTKATRTSSTFC